jgi:hypothetical protein
MGILLLEIATNRSRLNQIIPRQVLIKCSKDDNALPGVLGLCRNVMDEFDISGDNLTGVITDLSSITQCP